LFTQNAYIMLHMSGGGDLVVCG